MTIPFFQNINGQNAASVIDFKWNPKSTDPPTPTAGDFWYNTTENAFKYFDGTNVQVFANNNNIGSSVVVGNSPPAVTDGSVIWNNTTAGYEGLYNRDQTRGKWLGPPIAMHCGSDTADNSSIGFAGIINASNFTGFNLNFNLTITEIYASCRDINNVTKNVELRQRLDNQGTFSTLLSFDLVREGTGGADPGYFTDMNLNIDLNAAKRQLYFFVEAPNSQIRDVVVVFIVRKRGGGP